MVVLSRHENAHQGGDDDANVIFQVAELRSVKEWPQHTTDTKPRETSMLSQSQSRLNSKYLWFVSLRRASLDPGTDINRLPAKNEARILGIKQTSSRVQVRLKYSEVVQLGDW
jgi:hypothetical protein